jgi:hypothetical protein
MCVLLATKETKETIIAFVSILPGENGLPKKLTRCCSTSILPLVHPKAQPSRLAHLYENLTVVVERECSQVEQPMPEEVVLSVVPKMVGVLPDCCISLNDSDQMISSFPPAQHMASNAPGLAVPVEEHCGKGSLSDSFCGDSYRADCRMASLSHGLEPTGSLLNIGLR